MAKFFKGLASAGAWACFDEFNRIDIEVLSVVAQQISTIQKSISSKLSRFTFEGVDLKLDPTCAIFITMNPGYAGRTELPDNLKALFRPVAMMIPDYTMIAEISLISFGFSKSRILAEKMVATFRLSSEQLSSQDHYDFGMRAVKTVISRAGTIKRMTPTCEEELVILRALVECNLPKFVEEDVSLFNGIISDLFPGLANPVVDYGSLALALQKSSLALNLQPVDPFLNKCIQLFETINSRHGIMLVGPPGGGKTCSLRVLAKAVCSIPEYPKAIIETINPKSVTMGQLYGEFDLQTHEWTDGVVSSLIRNGVEESLPDSRWYVFDGPVDAIWIESMNTVLDDNKKLCLASGEIIKLINTQKLLFEVGNLAYASPATVSRCGMVYMEPGAFGLKPLIKSWLQGLEKKLSPEIFKDINLIETLMDNYIPPLIDFIRTNIKEVLRTTDHSLMMSYFNLFNSLLKSVDEEDNITIDIIQSFFVFSLIWTFGASTDESGRGKFDVFFKKLMDKYAISIALPKTLTVFDYKFNVKTISWVHWMDQKFDIDFSSKTLPIVQTVDTVRYSYLLNVLIKNNIHVLACGPTGTGKSVVVTDKIMNGLDSSIFIPLIINFSARTSANQTQDVIDGKLDKRRKQVFGPPVGKKMIIFIDDLNMPAVEPNGAQPPIELIRQWMDHGGWYDRKLTGKFNEIVDLVFVSAMCPPGGGR